MVPTEQEGGSLPGPRLNAVAHCWGGASQERGQRANTSPETRAKLENAASRDTQPKACAKKDHDAEPTYRGGTGKYGCQVPRAVWGPCLSAFNSVCSIFSQAVLCLKVSAFMVTTYCSVLNKDTSKRASI